MKAALDVATCIAAKSPVAVQGSKINLIYSRDHSVSEGLDYNVSFSLMKLDVFFQTSSKSVIDSL